MAAGTVAVVSSSVHLGLTAWETDIQTWLTANALGVITSCFLSGEVYVAILEIKATA